MKHILYKTTCITTNCFYIGIHSTNNVNDGYLGSGTRLRASIKKYGKPNHFWEILDEAASRRDLENLEEFVVSKELLKNPLCLNLSIGGRAGIPGLICPTRSERMKAIWADPKHRDKMKMINSQNSRSGWNKPNAKELRREAISQSSTEMWKSKELHERMSDRMKLCTGEKSSQFGTKWIHKDSAAQKVKGCDLQQFLDTGWALGRK